MAETYDRADVKAGACFYILLGSLQRLDARSPGLIDELIKGVEGDFDAVKSQGEVTLVVSSFLRGAQAMLRRANGYKQPSGAG